MKAIWLPALVLFLLHSTTGFAQLLPPLEVARQLFGKTPFAASKRYSTGEYEGRPNGQDLPPNATIHFLLLGQTEKQAVVAMTIQGDAGQTVDAYLHFQQDTLWKLCAFRTLAMTGIIAQAKQELERMTPVQVDAQIARAATSKNNKDQLIKSRADYEFALGNSSLTLASDDHLLEHFRKNQAAFTLLRDQALAEVPPPSHTPRGAPLLTSAPAGYRKLFLSSVRAEQAATGKRLNFLIGGILDNTVGYFYVTDTRAVPTMNPNDIIMVREIGDGWYLYKTT